MSPSASSDGSSRAPPAAAAPRCCASSKRRETEQRDEWQREQPGGCGYGRDHHVGSAETTTQRASLRATKTSNSRTSIADCASWTSTVTITRCTDDDPAEVRFQPDDQQLLGAGAAWLVTEATTVEAAFLDAALSPVEALVAVDARSAHYAWLLHEPMIYTLIETTVADAAYRRGEIALASGDVVKARWAAEKGLAIVGGQEVMYRMKMKAASDASDLDGVNANYRGAQRVAEPYGYDDEVQPETQELYEGLT